MKISHLCLFSSLLLLAASGFCSADDHKSTVEVVGFGECTDCAQKSIKTSHAFSGLSVTIDCKAASGNFERRGAGQLNEEGKFSVSIPKEIVKDGGDGLKEECYAQLHNAKATPCGAHDGLESTKVVFMSKNSDGKQTFGIAGTKLKFSPATCTSAFFWPHSKHPLPKLPKPHPLFGGHPKFPFPPKIYPPFPPKVTIPPFYKKPCPPKSPIYEKPLPPPVPVYKPPVKKPCPPPAPVYVKPKPPPVPVSKPPPVKKPCPPPAPVYKKPTPPPVPVYKKPHPPKEPKKVCPPPVPVKKPHPPPVPVYKKPHPPPVPVYTKPMPPPVPVYTKPLPPPVPVYTKPLPPPIPYYKPKPHPWFKHPNLKPLPPFPKIPPHPWFKKPPPYSPHTPPKV